ncbi:cupin domain-containing protein [Microbacterium arborescens]|uniref:cupin domain-containing protein n=1 Tax=Microbacterium arborescens TaxID=33883 RepID=UPI002789F7AA|nr:cupin domain-containing protein [Microbacterium arborescens]MDQ1218009.1 quercetin dioxygenase-like cupin family protein/quinol monooxygenase YgiN [Microbacterium arborescens]
MSSHTDISSQPAHVFRPDQLPSKSRGGGARTIPLVTAARGGTTYLNGITIFEPGAAIGHHTHNVAESVMVIAGAAVVDIDGERTALSTFDTTFVPANIPHHFENASATEQMKIFWTYGSLDATRTLTGSGEHGRVDAESADTTGGTVRIVTEVATITVLPGHEKAFEAAVAEAAPLFQRAGGARTLRLEGSAEHPLRYRLFVGWESVDDHMVGFRGSPAFGAWRELIGPHLDGAPEVEHLHNVLTAF